MADRFQDGLRLFGQGQAAAAAPAKYKTDPEDSSNANQTPKVATDAAPGRVAAGASESLGLGQDMVAAAAQTEIVSASPESVVIHDAAAESAKETPALTGGAVTRTLLGIDDPYVPSATEPFPALAGEAEPQLNVPWGDFRQSAASSVRTLFTRARLAGSHLGENFFKDSRIERRIPRQALVAAALWHIAFVLLPPIPGLSMTPRRNKSLENFQLTWSGPIEDLPLLQIPKQGRKPVHRAVANREPEQPAVDAFHPRQRIFTDPVKPTHLKQTLVNPKAPLEPPKLLPDLPNIVQFEEVAPPKPRVTISAEALKQLHPNARRVKTVTTPQPLDTPNMEQQITSDMSVAAVQNGPARPKLQINASAAPRVAQRAENGDATPAPDVAAGQPNPAGGASSTLIALSATPGPAAPVAPPAGNLAARVAIAPEAPHAGGGAVDASGGGGKSPVGVSITGGNPKSNSGVSGLGAAAPRISMPSTRAVINKPQPRSDDDEPVRTGPPDFSVLPPGAKPEAIFATKRVYTMNVNMPNLSSATGSWILNFSELRSAGSHLASSDLAGPVTLKKVDPKYPQALVAERVEGEVILYAVIHRDGGVDGIQLVRGLDEQLDANAMAALAQWKFRPATKQGEPIEVEAIVHIPFHIPTLQ
jgi:TonB family protein